MSSLVSRTPWRALLLACCFPLAAAGSAASQQPLLEQPLPERPSPQQPSPQKPSSQIASPHHAPTQAWSALVITEQGLLKGLVSDHREFRGIPFAAPPVGDLRFRAPQAPSRWHGVRDATQFGSACPQASGLTSPGSLDEDCLFLNVYTPLRGRHLPVMVWIHGGSFTSGTGASFDGTTLAKKGNVILVTINYRLGALGFLATPGLAAENPRGASGNYALLDQQAALRWVKNNIARFGGNPDNVTIFGESAGGASVCAHLVAPGSRRLIDKVIDQSGPCNQAIATQEENYQAGKTIATVAQCANADAATELACLRALPVDQLLAAQASNNVTSNAIVRFNIDGVTLKASFREAVQSGQFNRVPVLQGSNRYEGRIFAYLAFDLAGRPMTAAQYPQIIGLLTGPAASQVLAQYPLSNYPSPTEAYATVLGDSRFSCSTRSMIRELVDQRVPVYAYEFRDPNPPSIAALGPTHGTEILYVFQDDIGLNDETRLTPTQLTLSNQMLSYWTNFAHRGNPNGDNLPVWRKYLDRTDRFFGLTSEPGPAYVDDFSAEHRCDFWAGIGT